MNGSPRLILARSLLCVAGTAAAVDIQVKRPWVRSAAQGRPATPAHVDILSDTALS